MGMDDTFKFYQYESDDGTAYVVKLSEAVAEVGSFTEVSPTGHSPWPFGNKSMRHVWGRSDEGKRTRVPIASNGGLYIAADASFTLHGRSYEVQGRIGESRRLSMLGG